MIPIEGGRSAARLRFFLSAAHDEVQLDAALAALIAEADDLDLRRGG